MLFCLYNQDLHFNTEQTECFLSCDSFLDWIASDRWNFFSFIIKKNLIAYTTSSRLATLPLIFFFLLSDTCCLQSEWSTRFVLLCHLADGDLTCFHQKFLSFHAFVLFALWLELKFFTIKVLRLSTSEVLSFLWGSNRQLLDHFCVAILRDLTYFSIRRNDSWLKSNEGRESRAALKRR